MKKLMIFIILMMNVICANAQFLNDVKLGGSIICSNQFKDKGLVNVGIDLQVTTNVHKYVSLRAIASVNGFIPNGFDRYGTVMCGVQTSEFPVYTFADFGLNCNPSGKKVIGMAFDCGLGLNYSLATRWDLYAEVGIDRINSSKCWQSTPSVKVGVLYSL